MPIEKRPAKPLPTNHVPTGGTAYRVKDGDSWGTVAQKHGIDTWDLIAFNFQTRVPAEVNWYLRENVGCNKPTRDGKNWMFSSSASPGLIYLPPKGGVVQLDPLVIEGRKPSGIWFGIGPGGGGHLFVGGRDVKEFVVFSVDDYGDRFVLGMDGERWGPGLGGSAAASIVICTSLYDPYKLANKELDWQFDFQLNLAGKWGDLLKLVTRSGKGAKLAKFGAKVARAIGKDVLEAVVKHGGKLTQKQWEVLATKVKEVATSSFDTKAKEPQVSAFEIPLGGVGAEVSFFFVKSTLRIDSVTWSDE